MIDGPVTEVHLTQLLRNHSAQTIEGTYLFPLPKDAAVSDFQMTVDGQVLEGQVLTKEEARRTYEEIVRQRRDPALLEYVGHDSFRLAFFRFRPVLCASWSCADPQNPAAAGWSLSISLSAADAPSECCTHQSPENKCHSPQPKRPPHHL